MVIGKEYNLINEKEDNIDILVAVIHLMGEGYFHLLAPSQGKMDHIIPAIHYVNQRAKKYGVANIKITFFPLNETAETNLPIFVEVVESQLHRHMNGEKDDQSAYTTEIVISKVTNAKSWSSTIDLYINSNYSLGPNIKTFVVLGDEPMTEVSLQTSIASLSHGCIDLIRIPVGYNLQTPPENFNPKQSLSDQVIHMSLLGGNEIRDSLLEVARNPAVCEVLLTLRALEDEEGVDHEGFQSKEIIRKINMIRRLEGKKKELSNSAFSNNISPLKVKNLVTTATRKHRLTQSGIYLSGLLKTKR